MHSFQPPRLVNDPYQYYLTGRENSSWSGEGINRSLWGRAIYKMKSKSIKINLNDRTWGHQRLGEN